ncbi:steroid 17-alpha-hydroxylase/17,20 lyase-like isoform X2 [Xenia sp. Carnegie-2017]|nr:steroid 17-alpha-hydroxylase/17,20 lyase-like isoform X2 [Xenia sp. Carnegie-2017]
MLTKKTDFAGRPTEQFYPTTVIMGERDVATIDYGPAFVFRSKVFKSAVHLFGDQTQKMEKRFHNIVLSMFTRLDKLIGENVDLNKVFENTIFALMWEWISSERLPHDDEKVKQLVEFIEKSSYLGRQGSYHQLFPLLRYLPSKFKTYLNEVLKSRYDLFGEVLDHHRATYKDGVVRDITDAMILSYNNEIKEGKNIHGTIDDVMFLMIDIIAAGAETSVNALNWCILHLVLREDIQNKIHDELDNCMENKNMPNILDLKKFHFLNAFVCEVFRLTTVSPFFPPHRTMRNTTVMGHKIPKNMMVLVNNYCVNSDPRNWDDPKSFDPKRFLQDNGEFVGWTKHQAFMPFGLGLRACPGKELAKLQLLTILASFLNQYHFKLAENQKVPPLHDPVLGATSHPQEYLVNFTKRK